MPAKSIALPLLFRTYTVRENSGYNCRIWEAARATSAAPTFFKRIAITENGLREEFIDAGLGCNNPVMRVLEEAWHAFGPTRQLACVVSIGTGQAATIGLPTPDAFQRLLPLNLINVLKGIATNCEEVAEVCERRYREVDNFYFRFNVEQGMQNITLAEWGKLDETMQHTRQYLQKETVTKRINTVVEVLQAQPAVITTAEISM